MLLTPDETKALIEGVWSGKYSAEKLPPWLFDKLADGYQGAAVKGWGNVLGAGAIKDQALELAMQENVFFFAAHKTAQQLKDMNQLLIASTNKYDFVKKALQVNEKYNHTWYNTEYGVTKSIARAGRDWKRIEATADIYPGLKFVAVQDGNTRAAHAALNGIIRPVADPFWKTYYPPLDWSCRCRALRMLPNTGATTPLPPAKDMPLVIEQFKERVTDSRKIWSLDHPVFTSPLPPVITKIAIPKLVAEKIVKEKVIRTDNYAKAQSNTKAWAAKADPEVIKTFKHYSGSDYEEYNQALRGQTAFEKDTKKYVDRMIKEFPKAPKYEGKTYRNFGFSQRDQKIADGIHAQLKSGSFLDEGFFSTAHKVGDAPHTGFGGGFTSFKLTVHGKNGLVLQPISLHPMEMEVLFNSRTKFRVTNLIEDIGEGGKKTIRAELTEI